ncbi:MAG: GNAT family N-acetyltransferase [Microlunatus sp.]
MDQVRPSGLLVARDGTGLIVGFAALHLAGDAAQLTYFGVHPQSWGRGIATALLKGVEEEVARAGLTSIRLLVYVDNLAAVRSYERAGWSAVGDPQPHPRTGRLEQRYERMLGGQGFAGDVYG